MRKKYIRVFSVLLIISLALLVWFFPKILKRNDLSKKIKAEVVKELGANLTIQDLLYEEIENVNIDYDLSKLNQVGDYIIKVTIENETFEVKVIIKDTIPPKLELKELSIYEDEELPTSRDFIARIDEISDYVIKDIMITKQLGKQEIEIEVVDAYGNKSTKTTSLTIKQDKDAPVFDGLSKIVIEEDSYVNLKEGVSAFDERFGAVEFLVDDSKVNFQQVGIYTVYYEAKDPLGNIAREERTIEIIAKDITNLIQNFPTFHQYPDYPNGCESAALYNLLRFYKIDVSMEQIVNTLKKGDGPYLKGNTLYGGNPEIEFVGDPRNIHGYGVFQKPIIDVANLYKKGIIDYSGHSLDEILSLVKKQIPVQVWASINARDTSVCTSWIYLPTKEKIDWICDLHSVVLIGYNRKSVFVSDSYTGRIEEYSRSQFEKMYNLFGKRAIYYEK